MNEEKYIKETAEALGLDKVALAAYHDSLSPTLRKIGEELVPVAKLVKIALAPIKLAVWSYESIEAFLSIRETQLLAERKAKNIKTPPLSLSGPLVMNMAFSADEPDLREMYARLLASAMDERSADGAHPSFVNIIQQLTSDEAKILNYISELGIVQWKSESRDDLWQMLKDFCIEADIISYEVLYCYIDNLIRLRIFRESALNEANYSEGHKWPGEYYEPRIDNYEENFIELTKYGQTFLDACIVDNPEQKSDSDKKTVTKQGV